MIDIDKLDKLIEDSKKLYGIENVVYGVGLRDEVTLKVYSGTVTTRMLENFVKDLIFNSK